MITKSIFSGLLPYVFGVGMLVSSNNVDAQKLTYNKISFDNKFKTTSFNVNTKLNTEMSREDYLALYFTPPKKVVVDKNKMFHDSKTLNLNLEQSIASIDPYSKIILPINSKTNLYLLPCYTSHDYCPSVALTLNKKHK